jgi:ParB family chromosome partitioning protein
MLKRHPKNSEYFSDPAPEKYEEIKRSIEAEGIRDPLKVTPDYTVISGHVRLKIAQELGLTHVPVEIWDVDPEKAEYLMIADNEERRYCQDPVKKAKRAEFLKRYWGVRQGKKRQNVVESSGKTIADIAEAVGEDERTVQRLIRLNDLIPPLQDLVSRGRLGQTAAYSLAFLPPEEQRRLLDVLGESGVCGLSVQEAQELRRQLDAERKRSADVEARLRDLERQLAQAQEGAREAESLRAELARLREENEQLKARGSEVVEKIVERVVVRPDPAQEAEIARLREEVARLQACLAEAERDRRGEGELREIERQLEEKREELRRLESELSVLEDHLQSRRATVGLLVMLRKLFAPLEKARVEVGERLRTTEFGPLHHLEIQEWIALLEWYLRRLQDLLNVRTSHVIDIAQYRGDCQG